MGIFFISYELSKDNNDEYPKLWKYLENIGAERIQRSLWAVKGKFTTEELRNTIKECFPDNSNRLIVIEEKDWADLGSMTSIEEL